MDRTVDSRNLDTRIAIVGAGPGGLSAAWHLEQKGYRHVTVFERQAQVGGLCEAVSVGGLPYELGAVILSWECTHIFRFLRRYDMETEPIAPFLLMDQSDGKILPLGVLDQDTDEVALGAAVLRYFGQLAKHQSHTGGAGYRGLKDHAPELCRPFDRWLADNDMAELTNLFVVPTTCYGYGKVSEMPAAYALKYMNFGNFTTNLYLCGVEAFGEAPRWPRKITRGMQALMQEIAGDLSAVRTSCTIEEISRHGDGPVRIRSRHDGEATVEEFDRLVVTCKQDLGTLADLHLDVTPDEQALFKNVVTQNFFTVLCDAKGPGYGVYCAIVKDGTFCLPPSGDPIALGRIWDTDVMNVYVAADPGVGQDEVLERMRASLARMHIELGTIHAVRQWKYFPRGTSEALAAGFYEDFEALQGRNATYYSGALAAFECVEDAMAYSADLVERFF